jgi:hypothetical protein
MLDEIELGYWKGRTKRERKPHSVGSLLPFLNVYYLSNPYHVLTNKVGSILAKWTFLHKAFSK